MKLLYLVFIILGYSVLPLNGQADFKNSNEKLVFLPSIHTEEEALFYLLGRFPGAEIKTVSERFHYYLIDLSEARISFQNIIQYKTDDIKFFPNYQMKDRSSASTPNDPLVGDQYYLEKIKAYEAWDITTGGKTIDGSSVTIGVFEGGFLLSNPDIDSSSLYINTLEVPDNGIDDDENGFIDDYRGYNVTFNGDNHDSNVVGNNKHGNSVLGVTSAITDNSNLISGLIWNPTVLGITGNRGTVAEWIRGLDYIYTQRKLYNDTNGDEGAFVVAWNMSWGVYENYMEGEYPEFCNLIDSLGQIGILSIGAAGNINANLDDTLSNGVLKYYDIPTQCPSNYLVAVTSSDVNDEKARNAYGVKSVDIFAPGKDILTLSESSTTLSSGNSFAAPQVTAVVGLMYSVPIAGVVNRSISRPSETALDIKDILLDQVDIVPSLQNYVSSDGRLNAFAAVSAASNYFTMVPTKLVSSKEDLFTLVNTQNQLRITIQKPSQQAWQVQLVDAVGRVMKRQNSNQINLSLTTEDLPAGIYFLQVIQDKKFDTRKVFIH